jgi:hypothetical protein
MKAAHKQIEEIEKSRRKSVILSIIERLDLNTTLYQGMINELNDKKKRIPKHLLNKPVPINKFQEVDYAVRLYESIYFDFQKSVDIKPEDLSKLFPKVIMDLATFNRFVSTLNLIVAQMIDMKAYCLRLL